MEPSLENRARPGAVLSFEEQGHEYRLDGERVRHSVTKAIAGLFPAFDAGATVRRMSQKRKAEAYPGLSDRAIVASWDAHGAATAASGTRMHAEVEAEFTGAPSLREHKPEIAGAQALRAAVEARGGRICGVEARIFYVTKNGRAIAGSVDCLVDNGDGTYDVYDWKRMTAVKTHGFNRWGTAPLVRQLPNSRYMRYSLQLCFYAHMLEAQYGLRVRNKVIVLLHEDMEGYATMACAPLEALTAQLFEHLRG